MGLINKNRKSYALGLLCMQCASGFFFFLHSLPPTPIELYLEISGSVVCVLYYSSGQKSVSGICEINHVQLGEQKIVQFPYPLKPGKQLNIKMI